MRFGVVYNQAMDISLRPYGIDKVLRGFQIVKITVEISQANLDGPRQATHTHPNLPANILLVLPNAKVAVNHHGDDYGRHQTNDQFSS